MLKVETLGAFSGDQQVHPGIFLALSNDIIEQTKLSSKVNCSIDTNFDG